MLKNTGRKVTKQLHSNLYYDVTGPYYYKSGTTRPVVRVLDTKDSTKRRYIQYPRFLIQEYLGYILDDDVIVCHRDHDITNCDLNNLDIAIRGANDDIYTHLYLGTNKEMCFQHVSEIAKQRIKRRIKYTDTPTGKKASVIKDKKPNDEFIDKADRLPSSFYYQVNGPYKVYFNGKATLIVRYKEKGDSSVGRTKTYARYIAEEHFGFILPKHVRIKFIDENPMNCTIENFELMIQNRVFRWRAYYNENYNAQPEDE